METKYSRRSVLAGAALALIHATITSTTAQAQPQMPDSVKTPAGDLNSEQGSAIKTRTASCNCGQLRVTCKGPDPERRSMCHCNLCQKQSGSVFAVQARFPREQVTIEGTSTAWTFPIDGAKPVTYRSCDSEGATYHFCPECGSTVYWEIAAAPKVIGVAIGSFTDPTFPPPMISGFEEYRFPWAMNVADLPMPGGHHQ